MKDESDLLKFDYINSLPHPLTARFFGGGMWPIVDIEVQCGLVRIDVCGLLEVKDFADVMCILDADGEEHDSEDFYEE